MTRRADKTAIVTGGAEGIGRAWVVRLAEKGAKVAVFDRDGAEGRALANDPTGTPHPIGTRGEPGDIAWAVVWLASDEAKLETGADIVIGGGYKAR